MSAAERGEKGQIVAVPVLSKGLAEVARSASSGSGDSWMGVRGEVAIKGVGGEDVAGELVDVEAGPCTEGGSGGVVMGLGFGCWNKGLGSKTFS